MGVFWKKSVKEKEMYRFYRFTKGADYTMEDAIRRCDRALRKFSRKLTNIRKFQKNGSYEKTEDADNRKIGSQEES
jgi:hypothetical protein